MIQPSAARLLLLKGFTVSQPQQNENQYGDYILTTARYRKGEGTPGNVWDARAEGRELEENDCGIWVLFTDFQKTWAMRWKRVSAGRDACSEGRRSSRRHMRRLVLVLGGRVTAKLRLALQLKAAVSAGPHTPSSHGWDYRDRHGQRGRRQTNFPSCGRGCISAHLAQNSLLHLKSL